MQKKLKKILCGFLACGIMASSCSNVAYAQEDEVAVDTTQTAAEETLEPPEEPVEETNSEATPETASATQISVSVVDRSFEESDERIDYALFDVGDVESTMPYLDKRAATINALKDYDSMRYIVENTNTEIANVHDRMSGVRSPGFDGMPHTHNPQAGEDRMI